MGKAREAAAALVLCVAACHPIYEPYRTYDVAIPPAPPNIEAPQDIPAFRYAPLTPLSLRAHVERLASDQFEGRAPGTHGEALTVNYIERAFQLAGLQPGARASGQPSWEQAVPMVVATVANDPVLSVGGADKDASTYRYGADFVAWTKQIEAHVALDNAEIVFVGYGIVDRALGWNDYAGVDMRGKIALILANDPDFETGDNRGFRGRAMTYEGTWAYKFEEAARQGAAGAIIVHEPDAAGFSWDVVRSTWTGPQRDLDHGDERTSPLLVQGWITDRAAREIIARAGRDFNQEKVRAERPDFTPAPLGFGASIALDTGFDNVISRNVIAMLPGNARPQETVIYSAHWDHLGRCPAARNDSICNGAVDNATGVAGLIDLARRFSSDGPRQRSLAFIAFTGEESGLLGSSYYAQHPLFAPANTAAFINIDQLSTIGLTRDVADLGVDGNDLDQMLTEAARTQTRRVSTDAVPERGRFFSSDQLSFARMGVPVLAIAPGEDLYQGGVQRGHAALESYYTRRYHRPDDEITSDWDLIGAMRDLQLLYLVGARLADGSEWPTWNAGSEYRAAREISRGR